MNWRWLLCKQCVCMQMQWTTHSMSMTNMTARSPGKIPVGLPGIYYHVNDKDLYCGVKTVPINSLKPNQSPANLTPAVPFPVQTIGLCLNVMHCSTIFSRQQSSSSPIVMNFNIFMEYKVLLTRTQTTLNVWDQIIPFYICKHSINNFFIF